MAKWYAGYRTALGLESEPVAHDTWSDARTSLRDIAHVQLMSAICAGRASAVREMEAVLDDVDACTADAEHEFEGEGLTFFLEERAP
jgi:hypothetical protein